MTPQQQTQSSCSQRRAVQQAETFLIFALWTHAHSPWERVWGLALAGGIVGSRSWGLVVLHSLSPPGSRSRSQDCCSHRQTAFPLHLGSPRRKETVLPRQCKRCLLLPSRVTVSGSHHSLHPQRCESQSTKGWRKI